MKHTVAMSLLAISTFAFEARGQHDFDAVWQVGTPIEGVDAAWQATNGHAGMRTFFTREGIRVVPLAPEADWQWGLELTGFGRAGHFVETSDVDASVSGCRIEYRRGALIEWYVNDGRGLEQGFSVLEAAGAPNARGPLELELTIHGGLRAELGPDERGVSFRDARGDRALSYSGLAAWDATGRRLVARLALEEGRLIIAVEDEGAAYPLTVDPLILVDETKLSAIDAGFGWNFGYSVAMSGTTLAVGASKAESTPGAGDTSGAAYVHERSGTSWSGQKIHASDPAFGDGFGRSIGVDGDTVAVGAPRDDDPVAGSDVGSVYVFVRDGTDWTQQAKLTASDGAYGDNFGGSIAIDGNTIAVGSARDDDPVAGSNVGSVYVFVRDDTDWTEQAKLMASDKALGDSFGYAVSLHDNTLVSGSILDDDLGQSSGSAYVFTRSGTVWSQAQKLTASDGAAYDVFGVSVSLSGNTVLVGAPQDDDNKTDSGSAHVFVYDGTSWNHEAKLTDSDWALYAGFGDAVSLDGDMAVAGSPFLDEPFQLYAGSAVVFTRSAGSWSEQVKLTPSDGAAADYFGSAVAASGDRCAVGAYGHDLPSTASGAAYAYEFLRWADPSSYCSGKTNACGAGVISASGSSHASQSSGFVVAGDSPLGGRIGVLLYNAGSAPTAPYLPFGGAGDGILCIRIHGMKHARGAASGGVPGACGNGAQFAVDMNAFAAGALGGYPSAYLSIPGSTVHCQWWGRETPSSMYLTGGLEYGVGP